jgi:Transposase
MKVMIGVDPHKRSHTATMLDRHEHELRRITVRSGDRQVAELLKWVDGVKPRMWAVESAGGMGYLLAQQLVAAGETVVDVPAMLASRVRVLGTGQSSKSDPNDARSVAVAALRAPSLASVQRADHTAVCRLLAKHHTDVARWRTKQCCRLHALVNELVPGGISKEVVVNRHDLCSTASSATTLQPPSVTVRRSSSSPTSIGSTSCCASRGLGSPPRWRRRGRRSRRSSGSARSSPRCSSGSAATRPGSRPPAATPPIPAPHRSSSPPAGASPPGCDGAATAG